MAFVETYTCPPICKNEILRYAGCKTDNDLPSGMLEDCINEAEKVLTYSVCYMPVDVKICGENTDFGSFSVKSKTVAKNLEGCKKSVIFAATLGVGIDRLISKYSLLSPAKAVILGAIGNERIEALCDAFCTDIKAKTGYYALPRFSPGYSDFDLERQKDIFDLLNCRKLIGLTLNDSLLMSPSKSVTAFAGINGDCDDFKKCANCNNSDCSFRR